MTTYADLSGNGKGVVVEPKINNIDLSTTDATIAGKTKFLRVNGAGNVIIRPAGGGADITIAAKDGEYIPITSGAVIRRTGTTVTSLMSTGG